MAELTPHEDALIIETATNVAVNAAIQASRLILKYWPSPTNPEFDAALATEASDKTERIGNFATAADTESDRLILDIISREPKLAGFRLISEESDPIDTESEWQWINDPIDGTIPFSHGLPEFGVSIGLLKGNVPQVGVIAMPAIGQVLVASKGNGVRIISMDREEMMRLPADAAKTEKPLDKLLVTYDVAYADRWAQLDEHVKKVIDKVGYCTSYCSTAASNFRVALGTVDAFFAKTPTKFDIAAPAAIIGELGGVVTDLEGKPIDWNTESRSYLAAVNPYTHARMLDLLNS